MTNITLLGVGSVSAAAAAANFGYFAGGFSGANLSSTDRLDFAADTTAQITRGALSAARRFLSGYNSATLGYTSGGFEAARVTTTDGLTFSTDTTNMVTKGALTIAAARVSSVNSSTIGYTSTMNTGRVDTNNGLTFSTDTTAQVTKGVLAVACSEGGGINSSTIGYFTGGETGTIDAGATSGKCDGLDFASDTTTMVTKGALNSVRRKHGAFNSSTIGYSSGGSIDATDTASTTTTNGLTFSTDTTAQVTKGALSQARGFNAGFQGGSGTQLI